GQDLAALFATESGNRLWRVVAKSAAGVAWAYAGGVDSAEAKASAKTLTAISKANPGIVDCVGHGYSVGDVVYFSGLTEMTSLNTKYRTITASADADHFAIGTTTAETAAETTGGACVQKVTSFGTTGIKLYNAVSGGAQSLVGNSSLAPNAITSLEVYKVIGSDNLTGDQTHILVLKPTDGQPATAEMFCSRYKTAGNLRSIAFYLQTDGKLYLVMSTNGSWNNNFVETNAAVFSNGAQTLYKFIAFSKAAASAAIYVEGAAVAATTGVGGVPATLYDVSFPLMLGANEEGGYFNGQIALYLCFTRALSAAEIQRIDLQLREEGFRS
ncbi:MAG: hypothetical protein KKD77_20945, partial [Gammaproteobacteria bacterium]|nr:hypothetical protein [Gammaproteobacteria bacterium]